MATKETRAPYDRTKLSKGYLGGDTGDDALRLRDGVVLRAPRDRGLDRPHRDRPRPRDQDGHVRRRASRSTYDAALVATGGTPRRLPVDGADLDGVLAAPLVGGRPARSSTRADRATAGRRRRRVVHRHGDGLEPGRAGPRRDRHRPRGASRSRAILGAEVGRVFQRAAEAKGVAFRLGAEVERIETVDATRTRRAASPARRRRATSPSRPTSSLMGVGVEPATELPRGRPVPPRRRRAWWSTPSSASRRACSRPATWRPSPRPGSARRSASSTGGSPSSTAATAARNMLRRGRPDAHAAPLRRRPVLLDRPVRRQPALRRPRRGLGRGRRRRLARGPRVRGVLRPGRPGPRAGGRRARQGRRRVPPAAGTRRGARRPTTSAAGSTSRPSSRDAG